MKNKWLPGIIFLFTTSFITLIFFFFLMRYPTQALAKDVCAVVKIEILQEMTFERQAFEARMKISNGLDHAALENVRIDLSLQDEAGEDKTSLFFISLTSKNGLNGDPDGSGKVSAGEALPRFTGCSFRPRKRQEIRLWGSVTLPVPPWVIPLWESRGPLLSILT